jgi:predicted transcriptional regulator
LNVKIKSAKQRVKRGEVTRIAAALGVTKGHVSRCLRGERFSGRVAREVGRRTA